MQDQLSALVRFSHLQRFHAHPDCYKDLMDTAGHLTPASLMREMMLIQTMNPLAN